MTNPHVLSSSPQTSHYSRSGEPRILDGNKRLPHVADRRVEVDKLEIWLSVINTDGGVSLEKRDDLYGTSRDVGSHRDLVSGTTVRDEVFYGRRTLALVDNTRNSAVSVIPGTTLFFGMCYPEIGYSWIRVYVPVSRFGAQLTGVPNRICNTDFTRPVILHGTLPFLSGDGK